MHTVTYPCRQAQQHQLSCYIRDDVYPVPVIFLHGGPSTGKTSLLKHHSSSLQCPAVYIHCSSILSERLLYEKILFQLKKWYERHAPARAASIDPRCEYLHDMVNKLVDIVRAEHRPIYIILDDADHLLNHHTTLLLPFLRLSELISSRIEALALSGAMGNTPAPTGGGVSVLLVSQICWDRYISAVQGAPQPLLIYFPSYTRSDLATILTHLLSSDSIPLAIISSFIDMALHIFYPQCNRISELYRILSFFMSRYVQPLYLEHTGSGSDPSEILATKIFKAIQPYFKHASHYYFQYLSLDPVHSNLSDSDWPSLHARGINDLSPMTRYLLIASYLASYNPSKMDSRLFGDSESIPSRQRLREEAFESGKRLPLAVPRIFPLERMLAIFHNIVDSEEISSQCHMNLYTQLATLFDMGLIQRIGPLERLDEVKCRCQVSLEYIEQISKSLQFDIQSYLLH